MTAEFDRVVSGLALTEYSNEDASAPTLVLLHSMTFSRRTWVDAARLLAERFRCVAIDLPGHGGSTRTDRFVTVPAMADAVAAVLRSEGIDQAAIVGNSMGATVGVAMANQHPDLVSDLVLVGAAAWESEVARRTWLQSRAGSLFDSEGRTSRPGPEIVEQLFGTFDDDRYRLILADHHDAADAIETSMWALYSYDVARGLSDLQQRVLAVYGSEDPYLSTSSAVIRKHTERLDEAVIEGGSHVLPVDKPVELAARVTDWLTDLGRGRP